MQRLLKTSPSVKGEIVRQDDDVTVLRLPVTQFGSPEKKDLHGEYFHPGTYFGDDTVTVKFAVYEHFMNPQVNPYAPAEIEDQILGKAELVKTDDMARWYDFEVRRRNKYHDYVLALNEKGWLGTSSQCFPGAKKVDDSGKIDVWIENEVTLTPTPADSTTVPAIAALAKSLGLPPPQEGAPEPEEETTPAPAVTPEPAETDAAPEDFEKQIESILNPEPAAQTTEVVETPAVSADFEAKIVGIIEALAADVKAVKAYVWGDISVHASPSEGETLVDTLAALQAMVGNINTGVAKTQKGILAMAEFVAEKAAKGAAEQVRKSVDEQAAEDMIATPAKGAPRYGMKSTIPDHAPGG